MLIIECLCLLKELFTKAKICYFEYTVIDHYVFGFDISMHKIILVEIFDGLADIPKVSPDKLLIELPISIFDLLVQAAP